MAGIIAAVIGGTAAIAGGLIASSGAKSAAKTQTQAAEQAQLSQERAFERQVQLQEPFRQGGLTAQAQIMNLLGLGAPPSAAGAPVDVRQNPQAYGLREINIPSIFGSAPQSFYLDAQGNTVDDIEAYAAQNPISAPAPAGGAPPSEFGSLAKPFGMEQFQQDPGYAFRQAEGMKALERSAAARGNLLSGSTMKGIQRFGQDLASQDYQNAFNRYQVERAARLNPLQSLMGSGQSSANTLTSAVGQLGQGQAQSQLAAGQARASGYVGSANALSGALGGIGNAAQNYQQGQILNNYIMRTNPGVSMPTVTGLGNAMAPGIGFGGSALLPSGRG